MSDVPSELAHEILRRLPAESLLRFRAVCKGWRRLIDSPSFIRTHAANQTSSTTLLIRNSIGTRFCSLTLDSLNFEDTDQTIDLTPVKALYRTGVPRAPVLPVASCNGLILNSHYDIDKTWVIWNPLTRQFHELPEFEGHSRLIGSGLGYDSVSDDYKVVRLDDHWGCRKTVRRTSIYGLKSDSWRVIENYPCDCIWPNQIVGVFLNGALHWLSRDSVIVLVLETGRYHKLPLPEPTGIAELFETHLDVLGGCLVVSYYYMITRLDGWVMKDYGVGDSWAKLFSFGELANIGAMGRLRPVAYFKNRGHVFLQHDDDFFWLDIANDSAKKVIVHGLPHNFTSQIVPGSLFRLDESCAAAVKITAGTKRKRKTTIKKNKADARVEHSVRITDVWSRSDSTPETSWSGNDDYYGDDEYF
ncbi:hypothetical protein ABFS82_10G119300 [Erythranthe guttata]|uniref:F-box protein CPR30-like n=1 Tax=Erythranthe guttata TaxID=4155 RepID=UPI00064DDD0C|nr:PREDICTED: F-box protein CPR30-like [Erythranthe guttata]|eukprot:XP_012851805.1 PREDICTED: F-box protein CPR30-like [Erythranthe guttata]